MLGVFSPLLYLGMGVYVGIWIAQNHKETPTVDSPADLLMRVKQWITGHEEDKDSSSQKPLQGGDKLL